MDFTSLAAGTPVDCRDGRLGTLVAVWGDQRTPFLSVRLDRPGPNGEVVQLPGALVAGLENGRVLLNAGCDEVLRAAAQAAGSTTFQAGEGPLRIPLVEEQLVPSTQWRQAGALEIAKTVRTEVQELDVPLRYEEAVVERVPVGRVLAEGETLTPRQDGDTLVVPVIREELVVSKRLVLVEELRITKQVQTRTQHVAEEVMREEVNLSHPGLDAHQAHS